MTTRSEIERTLTELNEAENSPDLTAEQKSLVVDKLCHPDVQGGPMACRVEDVSKNASKRRSCGRRSPTTTVRSSS